MHTSVSQITPAIFYFHSFDFNLLSLIAPLCPANSGEQSTNASHVYILLNCCHSAGLMSCSPYTITASYLCVCVHQVSAACSCWAGT